MGKIEFLSTRGIERFDTDKKGVMSNCNSILFRNEHATDYVDIRMNGQYFRIKANGNFALNNEPNVLEVQNFDIAFQNSGTGSLVILRQYINPNE
ncbi:MAG: hypothetical protein K9I36_16760 [Bacteroidia bacterium]|nr:hypothetical protein [Bacteroidia bacterium]